jgi:parvulin-like peptidyl-prolyl isomerase
MPIHRFHSRLIRLAAGLALMLFIVNESIAAEEPAASSPTGTATEAVASVVQTDEPNALVQVGNKVVSASHLAVLLARDAGPARIAELVDNFVGERLVYEYGEENGVSLSDDEINGFIDEGIGGDLYRLLAQLFGDDAVRDLIRQRLIVEKVVEQKKHDLIAKNNIVVTDKEIQDYYVAHLKEMVKPESVRFQYLLLQEEKKAQEALGILRKDGKIEDIWKTYSLETNYDTNQLVVKPELVKVFGAGFVEQLLKLPLNEWSRLNLGRFVFIVRVLEKSPAVEPTIEEVREEISEALVQQKVAPLMRDWFKEVRAMYPVTTDVPFFRSVLFGEGGIELPEAVSEPEKTSPESRSGAPGSESGSPGQG